jgi:hypothetical protein
MSHDGSFFGAAIYMVGTMDPINKNPQSTPIDPDGLAPKRLRPVPWRELGWDWSHLYIYIYYIYIIYIIYILYYIILYMCVYHIHMYYIYIYYTYVLYIYIYCVCCFIIFIHHPSMSSLMTYPLPPMVQAALAKLAGASPIFVRPGWRRTSEKCGKYGNILSNSVRIRSDFMVISWSNGDLTVI